MPKDCRIYRFIHSTTQIAASWQTPWQVAATWPQGSMKGVGHLLVDEGFNVEGLHDVGVELRVQEGVPDALVQQLTHLRQCPA